MLKFLILIIISLLSTQAADQTLETECSAYCFTEAMKPLLQMSTGCAQKDLQLSLKEKELNKVRENKEQLELRCKRQVKLDVGEVKQVAKAQKRETGGPVKNLKACKTNLGSKEATIYEQAQLIAKLQPKAIELQSEVKAVQDELTQCRSSSNQQKTTATNCLAFKNAAPLHMIQLPNYPAFQVACEHRIEGPGWMVIQRRINGAVDFYRNWQEYRIGFGDLRREFFIGLENLYQLTKNEDHELLVCLEDFNGNSKYARYDSFKVANERNGYRLSLGYYSGSADDGMRIDDGMKFTTFDRDNDKMPNSNCAQVRQAGWWFQKCSWSNLNGVYSSKNLDEIIWWSTTITPTFDLRLKSVQMMIRPININ